MASVSSSRDFVSVSCGIKTYLIRLSDGVLLCIDHPNIHEKNKSEFVVTDDSSYRINRLHVDTDDLGLGLLCSDISPCGNWLAFCTFAKNLCVVDITKSKLTVTSVYRLVRGASKVKFTPKSKNIVVADKSGDVYLFNPKKEDDTGELILGHLSLLLDVLVTPDEQFIITCDRDEKIRVSSFPNGYNIIAYCLGHSEFVSSILLLPHCESSLISTSGDGTVRFWDYKCGTELLVCNTFSYLVSSEKSADSQSDEDVAAITDASAVYVDSETSLVCVCLDHFKVCLVLKCMTKDGKLQCILSQNISLGLLSPWRASISSNVLWVILSANDSVKVKALIFNSNTCCFGDDLPDQVVRAVSLLNNQEMVVDFKKNIVNLLFKRKFENVQEYLKKKEARLASVEPSIKKSKT